MTEQGYAAFISYNSADREIARRLQRALESYSVPRALRGRRTAFGLIEERIGKVCRDRTDFKSGESLNAALAAALDRSSALVVLCSPQSAASKWVNAEVEHFQKLGRSARIFPVVVATGESGSIVDSYPPALRRDDGDEAIAADLQAAGDGWHDGVLKILASILDVDYDALRQRALVAARRRARIAYAIASGMAALSVIAATASVFAIHQRNRALENFEDAIVIAARSASRINELTDETSVPRALIHRFLTETDEDLKDLSSLEAMSRHPRVKRVAVEFELLLSDLYAEVGRSKDQLVSSQEAERWMRSMAADVANPATRFINNVLFGDQSVEYFADELFGEVAQSLGAAYMNNGVLERARTHFASCREANRDTVAEWELEPEELAEFQSDALFCAAQQANVMAMLNEPSAAIALLEEASTSNPIADGLPASGYANLVRAQLYADNSRLGESIGLLDAEIERKGARPEGRQSRIELAKLLETRAKALALTGKIQSAAADLARADGLLSEFLADDANDRRVLLLRGELKTTTGEMLAHEGARIEAEQTLAEAASIFDDLIAFDGTRRDWRLARATLYLARSDNAFRLFESEAGGERTLWLATAEQAARAAIRDVREIAAADDEIAARLNLVAEVSLARVLRVRGDRKAASDLLARAAASLSTAAAGDASAPPRWRLRAALIDDEQGDLAAAAGDFAGAARAYEGAAERFRAYLAREPAASLVVRDYMWTLLSSAKAAHAGGDLAAAKRRLVGACSLKSGAGLSEYSLFVRDSKSLDEFAREIGVAC